MTSFYSSENISKLQEINLQNVDFSQGASKAISAIQGSMQTAQGPKRVTLPNASNITADLVKNLVNSIETKNDKNRVYIDVTDVMATKSQKEALTAAFGKRIVHDGDRTFISSSPEKTPQSRKRKLAESEEEGEGPVTKKAKTEKEEATTPTVSSRDEYGIPQTWLIPQQEVDFSKLVGMIDFLNTQAAENIALIREKKDAMSVADMFDFQMPMFRDEKEEEERLLMSMALENRAKRWLPEGRSLTEEDFKNKSTFFVRTRVTAHPDHPNDRGLDVINHVPFGPDAINQSATNLEKAKLTPDKQYVVFERVIGGDKYNWKLSNENWIPVTELQEILKTKKQSEEKPKAKEKE